MHSLCCYDITFILINKNSLSFKKKKEEKKQLLKDIQSHHASIAIIRVDLYQNAGFEAQRREEKIYQQQGLQ